VQARSTSGMVAAVTMKAPAAPTQTVSSEAFTELSSPLWTPSGSSYSMSGLERSNGGVGRGGGGGDLRRLRDGAGLRGAAHGGGVGDAGPAGGGGGSAGRRARDHQCGPGAH